MNIRYFLSLTMVFIVFLLFFCGRQAFCQVALTTPTVEGHQVYVISVDMKNKKNKVTPYLTSKYPGGDEEFSSMISKAKPTASLDGTFFSKSTLKPVGDIVIDGKLKNFGGFGTAMAITPDNTVRFIQMVWGHQMDWTGYETVLACGPRLIRDGTVKVNAEGEGFQDSHVLSAGSRSAVGITSQKILLLVSVPDAVTLKELAKIMQSLGCINAINLDGGASVAMYYRGKYILEPGRPLTNLILVYENFGERKVTKKPIITSDSGSTQFAEESDPDKMYAKAQNLFKKGDLEKALYCAKKSVAGNPSASNYRLLGDIYAKMNKNQESAQAYAQVSRIYYEKGDYNASVVYSQKALALHPNHPLAVEYFKKAQQKRGK